MVVEDISYLLRVTSYPASPTRIAPGRGIFFLGRVRLRDGYKHSYLSSEETLGEITQG